jgi:hypothetical protein
VTKAYAQALLAFLIVAIVNEWKGSYLDIDPLNVYFWLFAGVLLRTPFLRAPTFAEVAQRREVLVRRRSLHTATAVPRVRLSH